VIGRILVTERPAGGYLHATACTVCDRSGKAGGAMSIDPRWAVLFVGRDLETGFGLPARFRL
jgi:hypothetical protein